jgi:hypothetical protein
MRILAFAALAAASLAMSGCAGVRAFNSALVPQLKPVDARIHTDVTCGDMAAQVLGVTAGQLSAPAAVAIVQFCERRDATQTLTLDPQGARKVLDGIVNKPITSTLTTGAALPILP